MTNCEGLGPTPGHRSGHQKRTSHRMKDHQSTIATIKDICLRAWKREPQLAAAARTPPTWLTAFGLDSLEMLQFMLELEERLGIKSTSTKWVLLLAVLQALAKFSRRDAKTTPYWRGCVSGKRTTVI